MSRKLKPESWWKPLVNLDPVLSLFAGITATGPLWEQDIWWQLRLGDEFLTGKSMFPTHEEWTYTSQDKDFHNHWLLSTVIFSIVHAIGGVRGLVLVRGLLSSILFFLLLQLRQSSVLRWPIAAICFTVIHHRVQLRPELFCFILFVLLFVLRQRLGERDASLPREQRLRVENVFSAETLGIYLCVTLTANTHFGLVPFFGVTAGMLLADEVLPPLPPLPASSSSSASSLKHKAAREANTQAHAHKQDTDSHPPAHSTPPNTSHPTLPFLPFVRTVPLLRLLPLALSPLLSPHPAAGIAYILHHAPVKYSESKKLTNPEMQPLMVDLATKHGPWLYGFVALSLVAPLLWLARPRSQRPYGVSHPVVVLPVLALLFLLVIDRSRNMPYPSFLLAAMFGTAGQEREETQAAEEDERGGAKEVIPAVTENTKEGPRKRKGAQSDVPKKSRGVSEAFGAGVETAQVEFGKYHWGVGALGLVLAIALVLLRWKRVLCFEMATHNWPDKSTAFIKELAPLGNVYHTITHGGYVVYHLQEYTHFADTREFCFTHLDGMYQDAHMNPIALRNILQRYDVHTLLMKIPDTRRLPQGGYESVTDEFLPQNEWARVYFDHVSEVMVRRIPQHSHLLGMHIQELNPAFPPDYHARILLGREEGVDQYARERLRNEVAACLNRPQPELYCKLIEILRAVGGTQSAQDLLRLLRTLESYDDWELRDKERLMTREYMESTRRHVRQLLGRRPT